MKRKRLSWKQKKQKDVKLNNIVMQIMKKHLKKTSKLQNNNWNINELRLNEIKSLKMFLYLDLPHGQLKKKWKH